MRKLFSSLLLVLSLTVGAGAMAKVEILNLPPEDEARYRTLIHELRCLVCQNQALSDSNADLAVDMRREVLRMVEDGKTDDEIVAFLVERYGDFVRYRPPVKASTYMLWFGPFILMLGGLALILITIRRRGRQQPETLTADQEAKLQRLLDDNKDS